MALDLTDKVILNSNSNSLSMFPPKLNCFKFIYVKSILSVIGVVEIIICTAFLIPVT